MSDINQFARKSVQGTISASGTSAMTKISRRHLIMRNNGSKTAFIRLNDDSDAAVTDMAVPSGVTLTFDCDAGSMIYCVTTICTGAETTTLNYIAWN